MPMPINRRQFLQSSVSAGVIAAGAVSIPKPVDAKPRQLDEFIDHDALGMAQLIKSKEISRTEAVEIVIRRIEALDPIINAITTKTYERALEKAETIPLDSTFAGMPILIKDMIDVGGVRRTDGSRMNLTNVPAKNVKYIDGVESAGMNILGMTNVPEFAQLGIVTNNSAFGVTKNPWDLSKSAGGSSGGAGAAVAAGIVPLAHGTDGGGSNRYPPCFQGLFGVKPSRARMLPGEADGGHGPFKTNQAISRTVRDSAALFNETEDKSGAVFEPVGRVTEPSKRRLKIGYAPDIAGAMQTEPEVRAVQEATVALLEDLGHQVEEIAYPLNSAEFFESFTNAFLRQFGFVAGLAEKISGRSAAQSGLLDPFSASIIGFGASITDDQQAQAMEYLKTVPVAYARTFESFDLILSPVTPVLSIDADALKPTDSFNPYTRKFLEDRMSFGAPVNVSGHCAMSVPLNWAPDTGFPIGSMFQAATGDDRLLYELAFELEAARPWKDKWAPYSAKYIPV
ncbi:amidase [Roseibium sp.]|uniref:amidase n=1 Tax=Roseibium sp. TaxID=1936156 RepID=UPI003A9774C3